MRLVPCLLATAWTVCAAHAQDDLRFTRILASNGAPSTTITAIAKDSSGFYWFGTMDGILRYDGTAFTNYAPSRSDSSTVPRGTVCCILPDADGNLWVGTDNGLCRFDPRTGKAHRFRHLADDPRSVPQDDRTVMAFDAKGELLVAGAGGLARFDRATGAFIPLLRAEQVAGHISQMIVAHDGSIWLASTHGVLRYDPLTKELQQPGAPFSDPGTHDAQWIAQDATGRIWCAFWGGGLARWDPGTHRFLTYLYEPIPENPSIANIFSSIIPYTEDGHTVVLATSLYGLLQADAGTGDSALSSPHFMLPHDGSDATDASPEFRCMLREANGQLWVGGSNGLFVAIPEQQLFHRLGQVSEKPIVNLRQQDSTLFVLKWYGDGLTAVDGSGKATLWTLPKDDPDRQQSAQMSDALRVPDGTVLVASLAGLLHLDPRSGAYHLLTPGTEGGKPMDPRMTALCEAGDGTVWVGGYGPWLHRYDPRTGQWHHWGPGSGIGNNVGSILRDAQGRTWIGDHLGLLAFNAATGQPQRVGQVLINDRPVTIPEVNGLAEATDGSLWIATMDGIFRRDTAGKFTLYGVENGMPDREVGYPCLDHDGDLWATTPAGLTCIRTDGTVRNFTLHSSMPATRIGGLALQPDGLLALAVSTDLYRFDPRALLRDDGTVPRPVITALRINGTVVGIPSKPLELTYDQDQLSFTFVAPHFPDRGTIYRYMLSGADHAWTTCAAGRTVNYAGLTPGPYTFQVLTGTGATERATTLTFRITPPIWRTWWFMMISVLLAVLVIAGIVRREAQRKLHERILVLEKEHAVEDERQRIARDMHDDLGSGLTRIAILGEVAKRGTLGDTGLLDEMSTSARELVENLGNIVWVLDPSHDRLPSLLAYIREYAGKALEHSGITLHMDVPSAVPDRPLPEAARRNIFLIVKEALNNLLKHAEAGNVHITSELRNDLLRITIADDGRGFSNAREFGNGLRNMQQRASEIGGVLEISSTVGTGTTVELRILLAPKST